MATLKVWYDQDGDYLEVCFDDAPASRRKLRKMSLNAVPPMGASLALPSLTSANTIACG